MENLRDFSTLLEVLDRLRVECPWDRKQTFDSLKSNTVEECFELIDAINNGDYPNICEELGDMLLHIVFYAKMGDEKGEFNISDVIEGVNSKLIRRHPHVFAGQSVDGSDEVVKNWEQIKKSEKEGREPKKQGTLSGVPSALPALIKSYRIQQKAASVGFDWPQVDSAFDKLHEEITEFEAEAKAMDRDKMEAEMGDVLFSIVNCARKYGIDPENALERSNRKFISRFNHIETSVSGDISSLSLEQMDELWDEAKKLECAIHNS
ncbi:MAG: nucleoside triphosphate pyrophosphohydrolase [Rikenellaceae bacterium]